MGYEAQPALDAVVLNDLVDFPEAVQKGGRRGDVQRRLTGVACGGVKAMAMGDGTHGTMVR